MDYCGEYERASFRYKYALGKISYKLLAKLKLCTYVLSIVFFFKLQLNRECTQNR